MPDAMTATTTAAKPPNTKAILMAIVAKVICTDNRQQNDSDSAPNACICKIFAKSAHFARLELCRVLSSYLGKSDDQILTRCLFAENLIEF